MSYYVYILIGFYEYDATLFYNVIVTPKLLYCTVLYV